MWINIEDTYKLTGDVFENGKKKANSKKKPSKKKKKKRQNAFACSIIFAMNNLVIPRIF